jgi:acetylornithine deacetylase/succinyl-diaminopimelate desuccinylase-like protein
MELLRALLRLDTSNPPGCEAPATRLLEAELQRDGIPSVWIEPAPDRSNLVARLPGDGTARPLLLSCHLDTVPADSSRWTHPPFGGVEADGCLWGRGAVDMKGFAAMAFTVFRRLHRNRVRLRRDVIFAAVADEERDCSLGSAYLVAHHPELVRAEYAINEVGGYSVPLRGLRCYLIQTAERGLARFRIRVPGPPGHGAKPCPDGAMARAAEVVRRLARARLPHHVGAPARRFLSEMAARLPATESWVLQGLRSERLGPLLLHTLVPPGDQRIHLQALLSNTVNPTRIRGGDAINMVPSEIEIDVDGRTVHGSSAEELREELVRLVGPGPTVELLHEEPPTEFSPDTPLFAEMARVLQERDPGAAVLPYPIFGATDSRHYARLGTVCYGFYPLRLPPDLEFSRLFHGDDERIPLEGFRFGLEALEDLVLRVAT